MYLGGDWAPLSSRQSRRRKAASEWPTSRASRDSATFTSALANPWGAAVRTWHSLAATPSTSWVGGRKFLNERHFVIFYKFQA